jgi:hypothetical protein
MRSASRRMLSPTGRMHSVRSKALASASRPRQAEDAHMRSMTSCVGMEAAVKA